MQEEDLQSDNRSFDSNIVLLKEEQKQFNRN